MYAVIRTGGKQRRVAKGDKLKIEKLDGDVGKSVTIDDVLLIGGEGDPKIGRPRVDSAKVTLKIVAQGKHERIHAYKRRKRKGYQRKVGHRQPFTEVEVTGIQG